MGQKGDNTRERILSEAEAIILQKGFAGTSIDEIIDAACITKGGFFYHFKGKNDLALALLNRYLVNDDVFFSEIRERANNLSEDPLQQLLLFLKLLAEAMGDLPGTHPGCLVATFVYETRQVDEEVRELNLQGVLSWQSQFVDQIEEILKVYKPQIDVKKNDLADMLIAILEGGIIVSRVYGKQETLVEQILQFRNYVRLLFANQDSAVA